MKTLRKCLCLILGIFVVGLMSCVNDSSSDPSVEKTLDGRYPYSDGLYEYNDGNKFMYLYYENQNLVYAGNRNNEYTDNELNILKTSHSWNNVKQYCTKVSDKFDCKWYCKKLSNFELFDKGWYEIPYGYDVYIGYFEDYNSNMVYTVKQIAGQYYRTNNFDNNEHYVNKTWNELINVWKENEYQIIYFMSGNLDYYSEEPSKSE